MHTVQPCSDYIAAFTAAVGSPCRVWVVSGALCRGFATTSGQFGPDLGRSASLPDDENITTMQQLSAQTRTQSNTGAAADKSCYNKCSRLTNSRIS